VSCTAGAAPGIQPAHASAPTAAGQGRARRLAARSGSQASAGAGGRAAAAAAPGAPAQAPPGARLRRARAAPASRTPRGPRGRPRRARNTPGRPRRARPSRPRRAPRRAPGAPEQPLFTPSSARRVARRALQTRQDRGAAASCSTSTTNQAARLPAEHRAPAALRSAARPPPPPRRAPQFPLGAPGRTPRSAAEPASLLRISTKHHNPHAERTRRVYHAVHCHRNACMHTWRALPQARRLFGLARPAAAILAPAARCTSSRWATMSRSSARCGTQLAASARTSCAAAHADVTGALGMHAQPGAHPRQHAPGRRTRKCCSAVIGGARRSGACGKPLCSGGPPGGGLCARVGQAWCVRPATHRPCSTLSRAARVAALPRAPSTCLADPWNETKAHPGAGNHLNKHQAQLPSMPVTSLTATWCGAERTRVHMQDLCMGSNPSPATRKCSRTRTGCSAGARRSHQADSAAHGMRKRSGSGGQARPRRGGVVGGRRSCCRRAGLSVHGLGLRVVINLHAHSQVARARPTASTGGQRPGQQARAASRGRGCAEQAGSNAQGTRRSRAGLPLCSNEASSACGKWLLRIRQEAPALHSDARYFSCYVHCTAGPARGGCRTPCSGPGGYPQRCNFMQLERARGCNILACARTPALKTGSPHPKQQHPCGHASPALVWVLKLTARQARPRTAHTLATHASDEIASALHDGKIQNTQRPAQPTVPSTERRA